MKIGVIGEYNPASETHRLTDAAIRHSARALGCDVEARWISTADGHAAALQAGGIEVAGGDAEGNIRVIELAGHPFFIGTLFVPQARSTPDAPHPLVSGFLTAVRVRCSGN